MNIQLYYNLLQVAAFWSTIKEVTEKNRWIKHLYTAFIAMHWL